MTVTEEAVDDGERVTRGIGELGHQVAVGTRLVQHLALIGAAAAA